MSGGQKAKPFGCPLDGGVRSHYGLAAIKVGQKGGIEGGSVLDGCHVASVWSDDEPRVWNAPMSRVGEYREERPRLLTFGYRYGDFQLP